MKDSKRSFLWLGFFCGSLITMMLGSLFQDSYGLDGYLALARQHWTDPTISIPVAVVLLLVAVVTFTWGHLRGAPPSDS